MNISVIICTHNPDPVVFGKCLDAIAAAAANCPFTELIIVDNNSNNDFQAADEVNKFLQNHRARIVTETKQGLTPARLRGIRETKGDLLVFIDDDNFIATDFFEKGMKIATENPHIGSWSGQVLLRFEKQPEEWTRPYWGLLVHRELDSDRWSNLPHLPETMPCGAGLFVRREAASHYLHLHEQGKRNIQLDRSGDSLFSAGDNDLAACACDIGMGVGVFKQLSLLHYIPANRTEKSYLLKLAEGIALSSVIFRSFRGAFPVKLSFKKRVANKFRWLLKPTPAREFYASVLRGEKKGVALLQKGKTR